MLLLTHGLVAWGGMLRTGEQDSQRTRDMRQAILVAQLCDTKEEVDRFESGNEPGRLF